MQLEINSAASGCFLLIYIKKRKIKLTNRHNLVTMSATAVIFLLKAELGRNVTMRLNAAGWHHRPLIVCQLRNTNIGGWPKSLKGKALSLRSIFFCTKKHSAQSNKVDITIFILKGGAREGRLETSIVKTEKSNKNQFVLYTCWLQPPFGHLLQISAKKSNNHHKY